MENFDGDIKEKAQNILKKVKNEKNLSDEQETNERIGSIRNQLSEEKENNKNKKEKDLEVKRRELELKKEINELSDSKIKLQKEGKAVASELRKSTEGIEILKNKEYVKDIFGETTEKLKEIRNEVKKNKEQLSELLKSYQKEDYQFRETKNKRLIEFEKQYPNVNIYKLKEIIRSYDENIKLFDGHLKSVENFANKFKDNLGDKIIYDNSSYYKFMDQSLKDEISSTREKYIEAIHQGEEKEMELLNFKKGFFESKQFFDKKIQSHKSIINNLKDKESKLLDSRNKKILLKDEIEHFLDFNKSFILTSEKNQYQIDMSEFLEQYPNLGSLINKIKENIEKKKEKSKLSEEDQLILDLYNELL
ncbi:MAG: hypothetical protein EOM85_00020 [Candidatus Moranbacteria bacterium]|nr:hypothetical protein [Candidatus Moranbacteria bacterium]